MEAHLNLTNPLCEPHAMHERDPVLWGMEADKDQIKKMAS